MPKIKLNRNKISFIKKVIFLKLVPASHNPVAGKRGFPGSPLGNIAVVSKVVIKITTPSGIPSSNLGAGVSLLKFRLLFNQI